MHFDLDMDVRKLAIKAHFVLMDSFQGWKILFVVRRSSQRVILPINRCATCQSLVPNGLHRVFHESLGHRWPQNTLFSRARPLSFVCYEIICHSSMGSCALWMLHLALAWDYLGWTCFCLSSIHFSFSHFLTTTCQISLIAWFIIMDLTPSEPTHAAVQNIELTSAKVRSLLLPLLRLLNSLSVISWSESSRASPQAMKAPKNFLGGLVTRLRMRFALSNVLCPL